MLHAQEDEPLEAINAQTLALAKLINEPQEDREYALSVTAGGDSSPGGRAKGERTPQSA